MEKYKTIILNFVILWLIFFLFSMIAKWLNISPVDIESIFISTTIIAAIRYSFYLLWCFCFTFF